jgi:hypothetical protein
MAPPSEEYIAIPKWDMPVGNMAILQISYASREYSHSQMAYASGEYMAIPKWDMPVGNIAILQISYASGEYIAIPKWPMPVRNIAIRVWHMLVTCTGRKKRCVLAAFIFGMNDGPLAYFWCSCSG